MLLRPMQEGKEQKERDIYMCIYIYVRCKVKRLVQDLGVYKLKLVQVIS